MANLDQTDGRKKPRKNFTKVVLFDESGDAILNAEGKPDDDPTEARSFRITIGSQELHCQPFAYNEKIRNGLVIFGAKQRFTNAIGGLPEDEAFDKVFAINEAMEAGEDWSRAGAGLRIGALIEAIVRVKRDLGADADPDKVKAKVREMDETAIGQMSKRPDVVAAMLQIKAEKAVARADAAKVAPTGDDLRDF